MAEELLFGPLLRELKAERQLVAERERRSTFSGKMSALREELPQLNLTRAEVKSHVEAYYRRQEAAEIAALVAERKL